MPWISVGNYEIDVIINAQAQMKWNILYRAFKKNISYSDYLFGLGDEQGSQPNIWNAKYMYIKCLAIMNVHLATLNKSIISKQWY